MKNKVLLGQDVQNIVDAEMQRLRKQGFSDADVALIVNISTVALQVLASTGAPLFHELFPPALETAARVITARRMLEPTTAPGSKMVN